MLRTNVALVLLAATLGAAMQFEDEESVDGVPSSADAAQPPSTETITATGNLDAPRTVGLPFAGQPGLVSSVDVEIGDTVEDGDVLARVDQRPAKSRIRRAEAGVKAAKASLRIATEGDTPAQRALSQANITVAIQELANAQQAVYQARETFRVSAVGQHRLVDAAANELQAAQRDVSRRATATVARAQTTPVVPPGASTESRLRVLSASIEASSSRSAVAEADAGLVAAAYRRATTVLANRQAIRRLQNQVTLAARNLQVARNTAALSAEGGTAGEIDRAKAEIAHARAELIDGWEALDDTVLRAPFKGTVVDIAGDVGETPVGAVRGTSVLGAGVPGSVENRNPATQAGFVVLADLTHKSVTAKVAEAEIGKIAVGQPVIVTFPGTGATVPGVVRAIAPQESVVNNVVAYNVAVTLDESAATLKLGQSATVRITTGEGPRPRVVPNSAIVRVGEHSVVQVRRGERLVKIPVTARPLDDSTSEISSPLLQADDVVVSTPGDSQEKGRREDDPAGD